MASNIALIYWFSPAKGCYMSKHALVNQEYHFEHCNYKCCQFHAGANAFCLNSHPSIYTIFPNLTCTAWWLMCCKWQQCVVVAFHGCQTLPDAWTLGLHFDCMFDMSASCVHYLWWIFNKRLRTGLIGDVPLGHYWDYYPGTLSSMSIHHNTLEDLASIDLWADISLITQNCISYSVFRDISNSNQFGIS